MEWVIGIIVFLVICAALGNSSESKESIKKQEEAENQRKAAEDYIMKSGDKEAIMQLMLMKANPSSYNQQFQKAASGNSIMRTAFGVFTGFIAADLVTSAIHQHQLEEALANFETELESLGGIDNFSFADTGDLSQGFDDLDSDSDTDIGDDLDFFS